MRTTRSRRMTASWLVLFVIASLLVSAKEQTPQEQLSIPQVQSLQKQQVPGKHKVVVLLVDSLLASSMDKVVNEGKAPALAFFMKQGTYQREMISSFPTMSVTIDSSLLTGTYADQHGVPGLLWYHSDEQRIVNYGDGKRVVWDVGARQWLADSLYHLNETHLSKQTETLHETLQRQGYTTGSINLLIFRGNSPHQLTVPQEVATPLGIKAPIGVHGPDLLVHGALTKVIGGETKDKLWDAYGFQNEYTMESLVHLIRKQALPDVTLAFFPDMDMDLHEKGPEAAAEGIVKLDQQVGQILTAFGSWEQAIRDHTFILMGDSGVTKIAEKRDEAVINLDEKLQGYATLPLGRKAEASDQLAVAVNGRMSYIYALSQNVSLQNVQRILVKDPRLEVLARQEGEWVHVQKGGEKRSFAFRHSGRQVDEFGARWEFQGDPTVLGMQQNGQKRWVSRQYPDALSRLASVFASHRARFLVVTARPGHEFHVDGSPNHVGGGNHGSLEAEDSLFPVLVLRKGKETPIPRRVVDMKAYILSLVRMSK